MLITVRQKVVSFTLVNADTNQDIAQFNPLHDGDTINLRAIPARNLNIRANTVPQSVGSVRFALDNNGNFRTESASPYALAGDSNGDYFKWKPSLGRHTLTATPYTETGANGEAGISLTITINVIRAR